MCFDRSTQIDDVQVEESARSEDVTHDVVSLDVETAVITQRGNSQRCSGWVNDISYSLSDMEKNNDNEIYLFDRLIQWNSKT